MKRIFIFVVVLLTGALVRAQTPQFPSDPVTHEVTYTEEVRVPGKSGREIYDKAKPFVYEDLEKVKYVRFWGDENTLSIHVHGAFPYDYGGADYSIPLYVYFDLTVECHEGSYKYTFSHFTYDQLDKFIWTADEETPDMSKKQKRELRRERKTRTLIDGYVRMNIEKMKQWI